MAGQYRPCIACGKESVWRLLGRFQDKLIQLLSRARGHDWSPAPAAPSASSVTLSHTYNKVNQRIGQTVTDNSWLNYPPSSPSSVSYTSNALNQYTAVGAASLSYNDNGNLTSDGTFSLGYDAENRLISSVGGGTAAYAFDAQGRRKSKTVNGVTTTVFVTDAGNREVLEYDGASGALLRWYAYGLGSNDALNQISVAANTRTTFIPDQLGSIIGTLDGTGALSKTGYLPYGSSTTASGPFAFTGQRIDPENNGLYYYRARHYSPMLGRFVQPDPIGYRGGVNLYAYVRNDPLNLIDPSGLAGDTPFQSPSYSAINCLLSLQAPHPFWICFRLLLHHRVQTVLLRQLSWWQIHEITFPVCDLQRSKVAVGAWAEALVDRLREAARRLQHLQI